MVARLPKDKLLKYSSNVQQMIGKKFCTLRELKSLCGQLEFSTTVVRGGKPFLRRLYDAMCGLRKPLTRITITNEMIADMNVWREFLSVYNGTTIIACVPEVTSNSIHLYSDSSKCGYGGVYLSHFIYGHFLLSWRESDIQALEIYPIYLLIHIFSHQLKDLCVTFHCDNSAVVGAINSPTSRNKKVMGLLRPLVSTLLKFNIKFKAVHIPGKRNILCDKLSRFQVTDALLRQYGMDSEPTAVPTHLRPPNCVWR